MQSSSRSAVVGLVAALAVWTSGSALSQEPGFPGRLAGALPPGYDLEVELSLMEGGRSVFSDVLVKGPRRLRAIAVSLRPREGDRMVASQVSVTGDGTPPVSMGRATTDLAGLGAVVAAVDASGDALGNLCSLEGDDRDVKAVVEIQDFAVGPDSAGTNMTADSMNWVIEVSRDEVCSVEVAIDIHNLARMGDDQLRLDVRGGSVTGRFRRDLRTGIVEWNLEDVILSRAGRRELSIARFSGRAIVDRLWMERMTGRAILAGLPGVPEVLDPRADNEFMEIHGLAVDANLVLGAPLGAAYRLVSGYDTVNLSARLARTREEGGSHLFRVQMFAPDIADVTGILRVGIVPEVGIEAFDLLYRDLGLWDLTDRMEVSGRVGELLRGRAQALGDAEGGPEMGKGAVRVLAGIDSFLADAREHRMQASFRPRRSLSVELLKEVVREHPAKFGKMTGLIYGRHDGR